MNQSHNSDHDRIERRLEEIYLAGRETGNSPEGRNWHRRAVRLLKENKPVVEQLFPGGEIFDYFDYSFNSQGALTLRSEGDLGLYLVDSEYLYWLLFTILDNRLSPGHIADTLRFSDRVPAEEMPKIATAINRFYNRSLGAIGEYHPTGDARLWQHINR